MAREDHADLLEALAAIDPASLSYQEWVDCGMALHESGFGWQDWEAWSRHFLPAPTWATMTYPFFPRSPARSMATPVRLRPSALALTA